MNKVYSLPSFIVLDLVDELRNAAKSVADLFPVDVARVELVDRHSR